jgi:hypothetical protein
VLHKTSELRGYHILASATAIERIDSPAKKIHVNLTRDAIKGGPSVETAQIDPAETLPALWIM